MTDSKPLMVLGVDIETSSACPITHGAWPYSEHPTTIVYCVVFVIATREKRREYVWTPGDPFPRDVRIALLRNLPVIAHNTSFEHAIWTNVLVPRYEFPAVLDEQWYDTAAACRSFNLPPSLDQAAKALGCEAQKDAEGAKLMKQMAVPERTEAGDLVYERDPAKVARLIEYCSGDVHAMLDVLFKLPPMHPFEYAIWQADQRINRIGVTLDATFADACLAIIEQRKTEIADTVDETTDGVLADAGSPTQIKQWLIDRGFDLPVVKRANGKSSISLDANVIKGLLADDDLDPDVRTVLEARKETGRLTSLAKLQRVDSMTGRDGRLRNALYYSGAHTGRWSSKGVQLHNLPKCKMGPKWAAEARALVCAGDVATLELAYGQPLAVMSQLLRTLLVAGPGKDLIAADYSAIEARVLAWLADQGDILDLFRSGRDVYVYAAEQVGSSSRQLGKILTLALGYGMGAVKFASQAALWGVDVELGEADRLKRLWRDANGRIVDYWATAEQAFAQAIDDPGTAYPIGAHVHAVRRGDTLRLVLPSGRSIFYHRPHVKWTKKTVPVVGADGEIEELEISGPEIRYWRPMKGRMLKDATYGGKIVENITQAVARDLLGFAMLNLRGTRYEVVAHVHDSLASEVDEGTGDLTEFEHLISERPPWADGLPVAAEGYRGKFFLG